jgi:hypothetical protein
VTPVNACVGDDVLLATGQGVERVIPFQRFCVKESVVEDMAGANVCRRRGEVDMNFTWGEMSCG